MAVVTGLITVNGKEILEVDSDPAAALGTPAPIASLAMYDDGSVGRLYFKTGAADTAWTQIEAPDVGEWSLSGNALTGSEFFGSTNDQDVQFRRNDIELMRMVGSTAASQALLIGLNATLGGRLQVQVEGQGNEIMKEILQSGANRIIKVGRMFRLETVGAASQTFNYEVPENHNALVKAMVVARQTGGSSGAVGDGASYERTAHYRDVAGTVTRFGLQTDYTYEVAGAMNFTLDATLNFVRGTVTGVANRNFTWGVHSEMLLVNL